MGILLWTILGISFLLSVFTFVNLIFTIIKHGFSHFFERLVPFISLIGAFAAVLAVMQVFQDAELRNRPYVYAETKVIGNAGNYFLSETTLKNCGNTPAQNLLVCTKTRINGEDQPTPQKESKCFTLFPNAEQYLQFPIEYNGTDKIEYLIDIYYNDSFGNKYNYNYLCSFWNMGNESYSWKTIYSYDKKE